MKNEKVDPSINMIVAISKILKNGEWVAAGTLSPIPVAGCLLAKHTHAPDITSIFFGDPAELASLFVECLFGFAFHRVRLGGIADLGSAVVAFARVFARGIATAS